MTPTPKGKGHTVTELQQPTTGSTRSPIIDNVAVNMYGAEPPPPTTSKPPTSPSGTAATTAPAPPPRHQSRRRGNGGGNGRGNG